MPAIEPIKSDDIHSQADIDAAVYQVGLACYQAGISNKEFLAMDWDTLMAFSDRSRIAPSEIGLAWLELQRRTKTDEAK